MSNQITCGKCVLKSPDGKTCKPFGIEIKDPKGSCPVGTSQLETCDICGQKMIPTAAIIDMGLDHKTHIICQNCNNAYYTCGTCGQSLTCDFETNSIDLPKQVQKQIQTPQGYIVTTIRNPDRIRETCEKGCNCYDTENGCLRQNNYCNNHQIVWKT